MLADGFWWSARLTVGLNLAQQTQLKCVLAARLSPRPADRGRQREASSGETFMFTLTLAHYPMHLNCCAVYAVFFSLLSGGKMCLLWKFFSFFW